VRRAGTFKLPLVSKPGTPPRPPLRKGGKGGCEHDSAASRLTSAQVLREHAVVVFDELLVLRRHRAVSLDECVLDDHLLDL
jgi:hypothetical protein